MDDIRGEGERLDPGMGSENVESLDSERRAIDPVELVAAEMAAAEIAGQLDDLEAETAGDEVEIEIVQLVDDEALDEGVEDGLAAEAAAGTSSSSFPWYLLAPGVVAGVAAAVVLLRFRQQREAGGVSRLTQNGVGKAASALQVLSEAAGQGQEQARALAALARTRVGKTPPPPPTPWEQAVGQAQRIIRSNQATLGAIAASLGLTIAARMLDAQRRQRMPVVQLEKKTWRRFLPRR
ncbi:MAG TPA: hypothetical protein VF221_15480 [Chloroflexota bacterium]